MALRSSPLLEPDYGGTLVEGIAGSPMAMNPLLSHFNDADKDVGSLVFSGLTRLNGRGEAVPDLAESWEIGADGKSYLFRLRRNARWHDGTPFTAQDVVFTVKTVQDLDFPGFPDLSLLWRNFTPEKLDDHTVKFTLKEPFAPFLSYANLGLLPAHVLGGVPPKQLAEHPFNSNPIGTGPFKIAEATAEQLLLEANPNFHGQRPYLSRIKLRFFPDEFSAFSRLESGEVQAVLFRPAVSAKMAGKLKRLKDVSLYTAPRSSYVVLFLNNRSPILAQREVREALLLALDRRRIIQGPVGGQGMVAVSPILPQTWAYDSQVKEVPYDPEQAKRLLEAAGWKPGAERIREREGQRLRINVLTDNDETRVKVLEEIARELREIGVEAHPSASGYVGLIQDFLLPRRFDALLYGLDTGYDPDAYVVWHSSQIRENGFNFAAFADRRVDEILERGRQTTNTEERKELYREFQVLFAQKVPSILLYYPLYTYAVSQEIKGINLGVLYEPSSRFADIPSWYSQTKPVLARTPALGG